MDSQRTSSSISAANLFEIPNAIISLTPKLPPMSYKSLGHLRRASGEDTSSTEIPLVTESENRSQTSAKEAAKRRYEDWWFWEISSAVVSIASVMAIIILGVSIDQTALSDWTFILGPGTIISTLVTIAKTSMLLPVAEGLNQLKWTYFWLKRRSLSELETFDSASRGPWGALVFFWKIGARSMVSCLGCFLTVAALAMGPFAQQIITFDTRNVARSGTNSTMLASNMYYSGISAWSSNNNYSILTAPRADIQGAFLSGIFNGGSHFDFVCQSGNCTWDDFYSLGVCSTCVNVTKSTKLDIVTESDAYGDGTSDAYFTTPNGARLGPQAFDSDDSHTIMADSTNLVSSNVSHGEKLDSWAPFPELARASIVQMSQSGPDPGTWEATECLIEWCAKLYRNPTVTDGNVQPLSTDPIPFRTPPKGYSYDDLYGPGGHELPSFAIAPAAADSLPSTLPPFDSNRFDVSVGDHEIIRSFVRRMLNFTFVNQDQLTVASAFAYGVDVAALMGNMTDSLTNLIRTGPNATVVEGVVLRPETFISVQWAWLALPIALVLLSAAFLVATLLVSRRHSVPLWKSGLLPYIFHNGLAEEWKEEERREIYEGRVNRRPEMERRARGIGVKLTRSEEGETRLVRV